MGTQITNSLVPSQHLPPEIDQDSSSLSREQVELERLREENKRLADNREMRKQYADKAYRFAKNTLLGWAILVFLYVLVPEKEKIMDIKMFGIITTACTVNILVAFHAVIKGLFSSKD